MNPDQPWPIPTAAALLDRVCGALSYIHRHGILHLDLKPENVLCTPEGEIKIADFGLAQPQAEARAVVEQDQVYGTMDYCSLEQRHGLPADERSDLYSLAVLSYELLTGRLPGRAYEKASSKNPALPAAVDEVLRRGLARRRENRQGSIEHFRREMTAALQPRRMRLGITALAASALVVLAIMFLVRDLFRSKDPQPVLPQGWFLADDPESFSTCAGIFDGLSERITTLQFGARLSEGEDEPPLPEWPSPRPVLFLPSAEGAGFFHPLFGVDAGKEMLAVWPAPLKWPAIPPEDNLVLVGDFAGKRVWEKDNGPWKPTPGQEWKTGDGISVAFPPDRPDNPALLLDKSDSTVASPLVCYQWLSRLPDPGTVMVLRFRARAEIEKGRLNFGPTLPLELPNNDRSLLAEQLRKRSTPHLYLPAKAGIEIREYRLMDWIQPTREWQTYCVVWEWPPYCTDANARNVIIEYHGLGKIWLDDVELFTWQRGSKR
jgi:serine/threonine protein kinase